MEKIDFIRLLQTFRPAQTVFETGIGMGTASSQFNSIKVKEEGKVEEEEVEVERVGGGYIVFLLIRLELV